jgi:hypothetical protein
MFVVTDAWLMRHSRAGAWTRDQFAVLHLPWMPPRNWKSTVIGREISHDAKTRFEQALRSRHVRAAASLDLFR